MLFSMVSAPASHASSEERDDAKPSLITPPDQAGFDMGQILTVAGEGCDPGAPVRVRVSGAPVGLGTVGEDGEFSVEVVMPVVTLSDQEEASETFLGASCVHSGDASDEMGAVIVFDEPDASLGVFVAVDSPTAAGVRLIKASGEITSVNLDDVPSSPVTPVVATAALDGPSAAMWTATATGAVGVSGGAGHFGDASQVPLQAPVVAMAATPSGQGYWLAAGDGGVFAFGDAAFHGSLGGLSLNEPVVAMAATPSGRGYWLAAADGGVFAFGDAAFLGGLGDVALNEPVVAMAATPSGDGYWLAAADAGVFAYGDATFFGGFGGIPSGGHPVVAMAATPSGDAYWLVTRDGSAYAFSCITIPTWPSGGPLCR